MHFPERNFSKEFIKKHIHVSQMKNKLPVQITETLIFAPEGFLYGKKNTPNQYQP